MSRLKNITNIWQNVREVDLRPIREEAVRDIEIALLGEEGSGRHALADQLRSDPARPNVSTHTPVIVAGLDAEGQVADADLIIVVVDAAARDFERQQALSRRLTSARKKVIVFYNQAERGEESQTMDLEVVWDALHLFVGSVNDTGYLLKELVPAVMELLPDYHLSLGRHFPLFRIPIAHYLINDASFANVVYSLSTGLAEIVPVLNIPLNITDIVVLTKAQAFLVYRLGLALGFSTRWQDYVAEFGGVIGSGFLWRQMARYLVGVVPLWGIIPKVAVSYAGTFVIGHVVLRWYLTGRHVTSKQIKELYRQAFTQGKTVARNMLAKAPRPRLRRRKREELPPPPSDVICQHCGKRSAGDAKFCQYCGKEVSDFAGGDS